MHDYIDNLFKKISEVPEVSRGVNLLHQLQHCRESDRPISVIHHTMEALEQAMHMWQSCVNQQIFALVEEQKTLSERTVQVAMNNQRFNTVFSSHMRKLHLSMVPKHDHSALAIAKEGCEQFKRMRKEADVTKSTDPTPASKENISTTKTTATLVGRQAKTRRVHRLLMMENTGAGPGSQKQSTISDRSVRKRCRDAVTKFNTVVKSIQSSVTGVHPNTKKARAITSEEKQWVIDCIKSVPNKWDAKAQKFIQSRKLIGQMYLHCWQQLIKQDYPPDLQSDRDLRIIIKRHNQSERRATGHEATKTVLN